MKLSCPEPIKDEEEHVKIPFGKRVTVSAVLKRYWKTKTNPKEKPYPGQTSPLRGRPFKYWKSLEMKISRKGIFLGYRTLSDGYLDYDYEEGNTFIPEKFFKVALVCLSERENPVYVPLKFIK